MELITVEVLCPSTSRSYDYRLPIKMRSGDIKKQIIEDIRSFEGITDLFEDEERIRLYCENGCIDDSITPEYAGVQNGDKIMII